MYKSLFWIIIFSIVFCSIKAQNNSIYSNKDSILTEIPKYKLENRLYQVNDSIAFCYYPTRPFGFLPNAINNFYRFPSEFFKPKNYKILIATAVTSAIFIYYDNSGCCPTIWSLYRTIRR